MSRRWPFGRPMTIAASLVLAALAGVSGAALAVLAEPRPLSAAAAGSDDGFRYTSMDSVFVLGRDEGGRSSLQVTETIVAAFPEDSRNKGIRRAIPLGYDGHPTDLHVSGVSDETGAEREYSAEEDEDGEFLVLTIADDDYVSGSQSYVIRYEQSNVTLNPDNADGQQFYWDVNGTGWDDPFERVSATVGMDAELGAHFTGEADCYRGQQGSDEPCDSLEVQAGSPPVVLAEADGLAAFENLSVVLGFEAGTFAERDDSLAASPGGIAGVAAGVLALLGAIGALLMRTLRWRNTPGRGTVIAQYQPEPGVDVLLAAELLGATGKGMSAGTLDLAVNGSLRVVQSGKKDFELERADAVPATAAGAGLLAALFPGAQAPGARRPLTRGDDTLAAAVRKLTAASRARALSEGYRRGVAVAPRVALFAGITALAAIAVVFGAIAAEAGRGGALPIISLLVAGIAAFASIFVLADVRPLSRQGALAVEHLQGLKLFIRLAEADRLRMLQGPSGALRDEEVLRLHEKLLPYAVLFGLEKDWARELGALYERTGDPDWYSGRDAFNATAFAAGMNGFSSSASGAWAGSASSSSSSGLGGGGFSGGGGGGGGGGRV